ncbi:MULTISPECIES: long-chain fatty acid--CoA ligase [unclassified Pseudodesulfovibrio]|uniref:long-chain-fatty-acid--CoA ligase n=1 Tax=unclassified Pseudodesulfovibrio TaxID=2661612 RepID=UPI000FEBE997|nr:MULTISPECIES: long-chain fatty acid--CoA ligase [unclassified Pseudodesulfovibrio]MCJ2164334.1 long-chain fatty acid--CoA ligase [Pseudodesulfovibrio sp. S3-i]RWU04544.1 long-chain fatty acid--CoA ligase [Pseudodesulfovibrio sp. S3]
MDQLDRPWLKAYDPDVPPTLDYDKIPLFKFLDRAAHKWPKRKAIVFKNWSINYAKLKVQSEIFAANLKASGVRKGDRVALMLPNLPQTIIAFWGVLRAGAIGVMTNPLYMETEIIHQFNDAGVRCCITLDLLWPKLSKLRESIPVERFYITTIGEGLKFPMNALYALQAKKNGSSPKVPYDGKNVLPFKQLTKGREKYTDQRVDAEDTALLQYTGGTTGVAKGCILTHFNIGANMQQCHAMMHTLGKKKETFLGILPYFHIYGLTTCLAWPTSLGATLAPFPRYVPQDVLKGIQKLKPTVFPGAPSLYISLLQQKDIDKYDLKSIDVCVSGSAPMPVEYMEQFKERAGGTPITEGYGLTEASPVTHFNPLEGVSKYGSIGLPFPDTDAKIVDMEVGGDPLPPGKRGELVVRGPQIMKGYFNRPDATADVLRNGWLYTGDIATMDEEGYFYIVDRKKDLIISGGYNIYPREIDEVLHSHPKIKEAVSVGIPHAARGEIVKAFVVAQDGEELSPSNVISFCREKLASYKVPRQVEFRTELPKTMVGKVLRRALREEEIAKGKSRNRKRAEAKATADQTGQA